MASGRFGDKSNRVCPLTVYPNDTQKAACAPPCASTPSTPCCPGPPTFPLQHSLLMASQPGPLWTPNKRGKGRATLHPRGRETPPRYLESCGAPCAMRSEGQRWETPFASVPSTFSHPASFIVPLQRPPTPPQKRPPD